MPILFSSFTFQKIAQTKYAQLSQSPCKNHWIPRIPPDRSQIPRPRVQCPLSTRRCPPRVWRRTAWLTWNVLGKMQVMNQMFWLVRLCYIYICSIDIMCYAYKPWYIYIHKLPVTHYIPWFLLVTGVEMILTLDVYCAGVFHIFSWLWEGVSAPKQTTLW